MSSLYLIMSFVLSLLTVDKSVSDMEHIAPDLIDNAEVVVKSMLSEKGDKVLVDITLPSGSDVGFEIYNSDGKIQHLWLDQMLNTGRHQLALTLPLLQNGKYLLHIKVGEDVYRHLVVL